MGSAVTNDDIAASGYLFECDILSFKLLSPVFGDDDGKLLIGGLLLQNIKIRENIFIG